MTLPLNINPATAKDIRHLEEVVSRSGLFEADEVTFMNQMIGSYFTEAEADTRWLISDIGAAYLAPEAMSDGAWNVLFIAVLPEHRSNGGGAAMMTHIEDNLRSEGARLVIVESSGAARFEATRRFYDRIGYQLAGRVPNYYGDGDDKVIFFKSL